MPKSNEELEELRKALEKEHGRAISDQDLIKTAEFLDFVAHMVVDITFREAAKEKQLLEHPKGFHLEGEHTCEICRTACRDESSWYDKDGTKCITCQSAVEKKIIPPTLCKNSDNYYTDFDLEHCFNLNGKTLRSWVKGGILKARVIPRLTKGVHMTFYLIKDNKHFLPPKSLVKSGMITEEVNGKKEYVFPIPWYRLCDDPLGRIKKYGIVAHLVTLRK